LNDRAPRNDAARENVGAQAGSVKKPFDDQGRSELRQRECLAQSKAGLAQLDAPQPDDPHRELLANQRIQPNATGDQVAVGDGEVRAVPVLLNERFDLFSPTSVMF
jgi:hypothetical protein